MLTRERVALGAVVLVLLVGVAYWTQQTSSSFPSEDLHPATLAEPPSSPSLREESERSLQHAPSHPPQQQQQQPNDESPVPVDSPTPHHRMPPSEPPKMPASKPAAAAAPPATTTTAATTAPPTPKPTTKPASAATPRSTAAAKLTTTTTKSTPTTTKKSPPPSPPPAPAPAPAPPSIGPAYKNYGNSNDALAVFEAASGFGESQQDEGDALPATQTQRGLDPAVVHPDMRICHDGKCMNIKDDWVLDGHPEPQLAKVSYSGMVVMSRHVDKVKLSTYCDRVYARYRLGSTPDEQAVLLGEIRERCPTIWAAMQRPTLNPPDLTVKTLKPCKWMAKPPSLPAWKGSKVDEIVALARGLVNAGLTLSPGSGLALGMYRHHGLIPNDTDLDLTLPAWLNLQLLPTEHERQACAQYLRTSSPVHMLQYRGQLPMLCNRTATEWGMLLEEFVHKHSNLYRHLSLQGYKSFNPPHNMYGYIGAISSSGGFPADLMVVLANTHFTFAWNQDHMCKCSFYGVDFACHLEEDMLLYLSIWYGPNFMKPDRPM